jgi:hypothetical protein
MCERVHEERGRDIRVRESINKVGSDDKDFISEKNGSF